MKNSRHGRSYALLACVISFGIGTAQAADAGATKGANAQTPIPAIQDWSSKSIIHRQPKSPDQFIAEGRQLEMQRAYRDPRYVAAILRQVESDMPRMQRQMPAKDTQKALQHHRRRLPKLAAADVQRDWSHVLGGVVGGSGIEGVFPAKYSFDIDEDPSCAADFVVYPTNAAGATDSNGTNRQERGTFDGNDTTGTITIGTGGRIVTLTASTSNNDGLNFQVSSGNTNAVRNQKRDNLILAINRWSHQTGVSAAADGTGRVRMTAVNSGSADIAISTTSNGAGFGDFDVPETGSGTRGQPTITAFNNLYKSLCGADTPSAPFKPSVMWAYNTGTGYIAETSPVLSYLDDAEQVAFVQRNASGSLQLVLLKWQAGQGTASAPHASTAVAPGAYRSCPGSCYTTFSLQASGATQTWSSPYVDYGNDELWVGDTSGQLHKFTGVFQGMPAVAPGFPVTVASGMKLSSPVAHGGNVYVGSQSGGAGVGGKLHRVDAGTGSVSSSIKLANNNTIGLRESPIVDGFTGSVFAFLFNDGSAGDGSTCTTTSNNDNACRVVARFATGFANNAAPLQRAYVGRGNNANSTLFSGAFDEEYYTSPDADGAMYIVGGAPNDTFVVTLWKIPLDNGVMQTPIAGRVVGENGGTVCNSNGNCLTGTWNWSPVSVIKNGDNEYLYFSMSQLGSANGCAGACLYMLNLADLNGSSSGTGSAWGPANQASAALAVPGGTSGIIVDNVSSDPGASQIYFSHTGSTGNAVQASQAGLE